jgi:hypothetical protein
MPARQRNARAWRPFAARLADELSALLDDVDALLDRSEIRNVDPNRRDGWGNDSGVAFIGFAQWGWAKGDDDLVRRRLDLIPRWERWQSLFDLLFRDPPHDVRERISTGRKLIDSWIRRPGGDHSIPSTIPAAKARLRERTAGLLELLAMKAGADAAVIAVPDTNALILSPDVGAYGQTLGADEYEVHLVTTVVSELDRLKVEGRTPELRDKAQAVIRRIKGFRDRGSLVDGVNVTKSVRVFGHAREPDFGHAPPWLDRENDDDRILAAAMDLQGSRASATVVLVTGDLNLQTKAENAGMPYVEVP